jgi:hypothetical protein
MATVLVAGATVILGLEVIRLLREKGNRVKTFSSGSLSDLPFFYTRAKQASPKQGGSGSG